MVIVRVIDEVVLVGVVVGEGGCRVLGYSVGRWRRHLGGRPECCVVPEATGYEVVLVGRIDAQFGGPGLVWNDRGHCMVMVVVFVRCIL